ncbi:MAG TPA: RecX family transcriptional regulator, partial [Dehalococcoidia bacterium]|nr:RecX family transcriptional regulator [Dehalococcoidia bacterium]
WELGGKGIPRELSDAALDGLDDDDAALAAASRRAPALDPHDEEAFRRRLTGFLRRRGFSWEVTQRTIDHLWNATQAGPSA